MTRARLVFALIAVIVASTVFGGVAAAVGTAKTDKLAACTSHKHVRVLAKKVRCRSGEKYVSWRVKGEPGPAGPRGPAGPSGNVGNVRTATVLGPAMINPAAGAVTTADAYCKLGEQAVGGGFTFANQAQLDVVQESMPVIGTGGLQGWHVKIAAMPPLAGDHFVKVYVICAKT
jgi:hypothetical protein